MKQNFEDQNLDHGETWSERWKKLLQDFVWGDEIFLQTTAYFLKLDILIFSTLSTETNPFTHLAGVEEGASSKPPDLIVGYTGSHYQSLLPSTPGAQPVICGIACSPKKSSPPPSQTVSTPPRPVGLIFTPGTASEMTPEEKKRMAARERQRKRREAKKAQAQSSEELAKKREQDRLRKAKSRGQQREADPAAFKEKQNKEKAKSDQAKKAEDPDLFKAAQTSRKVKSRGQQRKADLVAFREKQNKEKAKSDQAKKAEDPGMFKAAQTSRKVKSRAQQRDANPVAFKEKQNKEKAKSVDAQRKRDYSAVKRDANERQSRCRETNGRLPEPKKRKTENSVDRRRQFELFTMLGPVFICVCCHMKMFRHSVKILTKEMEAKIDALMLDVCDWIQDRSLRTKVSIKWPNLKVPAAYKNSENYGQGERFICSTCQGKLMKKKLPSVAVKNNLELHETDQELLEQNLNLTDLEANLVSPRIIFHVITLLPRSRWENLKKQNILVPIPADTINETLSQMPRLPQDGGLIPIALKRRQDLKNSHKKQYVCPDRVVRFTKKMKEHNNPHFKDINCDCSSEEYEARVQGSNYSRGKLLLDDEVLSDDSSARDSTARSEAMTPSGDTHVNVDDAILEDDEEREEAIEKEEWEKEQDDLRNDPVKKYQFPGYDNSSCCIDNFPEMTISPGEGQRPLNMRTDKDWDVMAFPHLNNPDGSNGKDHPRKVNLTAQRYFIQRILNKEMRFARNSSFKFAAVAYLEQQRISGNISLVGRRGKQSQIGGTVSYQLDDAFRALERIKNTPTYWKTMKYEMLAKLDNLGPFQFFFTLSCADMRWDTNFASILMDRGYSLNYHCQDVDGVLEVSVEVRAGDGTWVPMAEFIENHLESSYHELIQQNVLTATRNFNHRAKQFLKQIVLSSSSPMKVRHYSYKVEFQGRADHFVDFGEIFIRI